MTVKAIPFCVLRILQEFSDDRHPMTASAIIEKMNELYGLEPDRRSIYVAIDLLKEMEYDISDDSREGQGYFLASRLLEPSQAQLLMDVISSFPFLPQKQSKDLTEQMKKLFSVYQLEEVKSVSIQGRDKESDCRTVFGAMETLDEAITRKKKVSFYYTAIGTDLKPHRKKEKDGTEKYYRVNPYGLTYMNERYYLACEREDKEGLLSFRLDRMESVKVLDEPARWKMPRKKVEELLKNATYAFSNDPINVVLECDCSMIDHVVDKFGKKISVQDSGNGRVRISLKSSHDGILYWALQYLKNVEVIEPASLREEIIKDLQNSFYLKKLLRRNDA